MIRQLVQTKRILVCAGPGGVGKTTTAAALGLLAARQGRKTLVSTIDPAPRLADALGLGNLSADPRALPPETARALGIEGPGALFAARLDTARAFKNLVEDQVQEPEMRERIFANPIYRQITSTLTGSQEYAATLALHDLERRGEYDLIVLDTPPTAHALDFLEAPKRIAGAISSPAVQWFARPPAQTSFLSWQRLRAGPALAVRRLGKFVGSRFLDDLGAFLLDFRDVLGGFLERAQSVEALLRRPETGFLLVLSPDVPAVSEALYFSARLRAARIPLLGFIANRVLTPPGLTDEEALRRQLGALARVQALPAATVDIAAHELAQIGAYLDRLARAQRREIERLAHDAQGIDITTVPLLTHDVSNIESLRRVGDHLAMG
jgi:anion-transporting  ArsA/GET3 family ATPase